MTLRGTTDSAAGARVGHQPHRVAVLCLPPLVGFDMGIVPQVLGAARDTDGHPLYEIRVCALDPGPVPTTKGYAITVEHGVEALAWADTVVVPGTRHAPSRDDGSLGDALAAAWATIRPEARRVSVCTGAYVLAAAGVLDGLRATTHWEHADHFARLHPQIDLDPDVLFVDQGDVLTSAGLGAGIDLCLHLVRRDFGSDAANRAARACVVPPFREGGQAQFITHTVPDDEQASTAATRTWARGRIGEVTRVEQLVAHAHMSERTFSRRFRAETGQSPQQWLLQARLDRALELLETTSLPVDRVAAEAGFGATAAMRQRMRVTLGTSPQRYRATFTGT